MRKLHRYTGEQKQFIQDISPGRYNDEITRLFNEKFGTNLSVSQIRSFKANHGIKSGVSRCKPNSRKGLFTIKQKEFIQQNYKGVSNKKLADIVNEKFGLSITPKQIATYKKNNKLNSGLTGRFEKGQTPWNKGMKGLDIGGKGTRFKKGHRPVTYKPIGSERIDSKDGYILIKVSDNEWRHKHVVVWEQKRGKIPDDHVVVFLDGDKTNLDINNLTLLSRSELLRMNQNNFFSNDPEITKAGIILVKIKEKISEFELNKGDPERFLKYMKIAECNGIKRDTFITRIRRGWSIQDAATKPLYSKVKTKPNH